MQKLLNLSHNPNPFATVSTILASRYVGGFGYSNVRTTTEREESAPVQTRVELGDETTRGVEVLRISNDRAHLEGRWNVRGRAVVETQELTTEAPKHEVSQRSETHGYTVSLSPAAVLGTGLGVSAAVGCLPSVSVQNGAGSSTTTVHAPMTLEADDLFIRCDDAVFRGAQIRARLLEAIVTNDPILESLCDEFFI